MSAYDSNARRRSQPSSASKRARHSVAVAATASMLAVAFLWACGSSDSGNGNSGFTGSNSGNQTGNSGSGTGNSGSGTGNSGSGTGNSGSGTGNSGSGTGNSGSGTTGTGSGNSGTNSGSTGTTGTTGTNSGTTGSSGNTGTTGTSGTSGSSADAGPCDNTNTSILNEDARGVVCNNKWNISGAWYCFSDPAGSSTSCPPPGTGVIPYNASSKAMCLSGTTSTQAASAMSYGAAIGVQLNSTNPFSDAGVAQAFNAQAQNIVGFAITLSGTSGGATLAVTYPGNLMDQTENQENPSVMIPGLDSTTSPITYNVLFKDAIVSDNDKTTPVLQKVVDPTDVTDVQVKIGVDQTAHQYNFCITNIVPITAAPAAPASITAYGPTFTQDSQIVISGLGPYGVQNDPFNVGMTDNMSMSISYGAPGVGFTAKPTFGSTGNTPGAFPSVVYGWIKGGNFVGGTETGGYAGGKTISSLTSVTSSWSFTPGSGNWDAAYDCWFGSASDSLSPGNELMIWLNHANVNPISNTSALTAVTVANATNGPWQAATGTNGTNQPVVSYVATTGVSSVTNFNLLPFFKDAAMNGRASLSTGSYFLGCQTGFEVYNSGTFTTNSFTMSAN